MIYRLSDLGIISERKKATYFFKRNTNIEYKNYCDLERFTGNETSERYNRLVYKALSQEIISISKASALLDKSVENVRNELAVI